MPEFQFNLTVVVEATVTAADEAAAHVVVEKAVSDLLWNQSEGDDEPTVEIDGVEFTEIKAIEK
jgi:hypothetical protein